MFCFQERERLLRRGIFFLNSVSNGRVRVRNGVVLRSRFWVCLPDKINKKWEKVIHDVEAYTRVQRSSITKVLFCLDSFQHFPPYPFHSTSVIVRCLKRHCVLCFSFCVLCTRLHCFKYMNFWSMLFYVVLDQFRKIYRDEMNCGIPIVLFSQYNFLWDIFKSLIILHVFSKMKPKGIVDKVWLTSVTLVKYETLTANVKTNLSSAKISRNEKVANCWKSLLL